MSKTFRRAVNKKGQKVLISGWNPGFPYFENELQATEYAREDAIREDQYRYVIKHENVLVVCGYADIHTDFDGNWDNVIYSYPREKM